MTMSALSITNPMPSERRVTGGILFLLAGLAALGALATNIILPAFPRIGAALGVSSQELELMLSSFFVAFAFGQLLVGPLSDRFGRKWLVLGGLQSLLPAVSFVPPPTHCPSWSSAASSRRSGLAPPRSCRAPLHVICSMARRSRGLWR
jgi:MFS family permease